MRLAALVIWYNPQNSTQTLENIKSYASAVEKVIIVDNSACDNRNLAQEIFGAEYIPNMRNLGIAAAQNIACREAKKQGFEWAITMDQDSYFDKEQIQNYIQLAAQYTEHDKTAQSFSLQMLDTQKQIFPVSVQIKLLIKQILKKIFGKDFSKPKKVLPDIDHPDRVIASGNIINLNMWEKVGCFDERLFIDEVDFDFCIRLLLSGYKITRFNTVFLNHTLGAKRKSLFLKCSYHNDFRLYYIIRNKLIEKKRYGHILHVQNRYKKELRTYFKDYCILDWKALKHLAVFFRAWHDYREFIKTDPTFLQLKK